MRRRAVLLLTVMMTATLLMVASPAWARTFTVNSMTDRGDQSIGDGSCFTGVLVPGGGISLERECTLRAAIQEANFNDEPDMIIFASWLPSGTITLTQGQLTIANDTIGPDVTVEGPGGSNLSVSGNNNSRVFEIASGTDATIKGLTISGGSISSGIAPIGGGILNNGTLTLTNATVSGNTSGTSSGGIMNNGGLTAILTNTIVARNTATTSPDAGGTFSSEGHNLIGNTSGSSGWVTSDLLNRNLLLGPLQNNGGPTNTRALWPGSPAIDHAANTSCPSTDQRVVDRPKDGDGNGTVICDIGAYERSDFTSPKVTSTAPGAGATRVRRSTNLTATFSEKMTRSTLNTSTFKLFRVNSDGSTTQITNVTVNSTTDGLKATLNPFGTSSTLLGANTTYRAEVTTGARDLAGNQLDQSPTLAGKQQKVWTFTTGSS